MKSNSKRPTILFNCSTNNIGGGMKNSALFILESLRNESSIQWIYAISTGVEAILGSKNIEMDDRFMVFKASPARNKQAKKQLISLTLESKADLVYTMAGPAYLNFPVYHIQGLSNAFITHANLKDFNLEENILKRFKLLLSAKIRLFYSKRADFFIFQTEEARKGFCRKADEDIINTEVISNAFDVNFFSSRSKEKKEPCSSKTFRIFCPGAAYIHKAFQFIPQIANDLRQCTDIPFQFIITLPNGSLLKQIEAEGTRLNVCRFIRNVGHIDYSEIAGLYSEMDLVFVPSLLETFSATYLEAICANKILVVANREFAKEVCGDVAYYVDPINSYETSKTLASIIENPTYFEHTNEARALILGKYGNQNERFKKIMSLLNSRLVINEALKSTMQ